MVKIQRNRKRSQDQLKSLSDLCFGGDYRWSRY